jgi:Alw26I/Eco31I/Esp3I family type II restriction endonuclease
MANQIKKQLYGDHRRPWSEAFVVYMQQIVEHPNFKGMPSAIDDDGRIRWNAPSNRPPGKWQDLRDRRLVWWRKKAEELGIEQNGKWISKVVKAIHPLQEKPCQTCGRVMSLNYVYPTKNALKKINAALSEKDKVEYDKFLTIYEVAQYLEGKLGKEGVEVLEKLFPQLKDVQGKNSKKIIEFLAEKIVPKEPKGILSPGSMSNAPDRLDGFHTYNLCCRHRQDTGRSSDNLRTYSDDRRAFEFWCEGDWAAANLLMTLGTEGVCPECGQTALMTADHIGPISLGFTHRPRFQPMCGSCNSSKGNRLSFRDVKELIHDESLGEIVISRQIRSLWNLTKNKIKTNEDANKLSKLLRINQHYYLILLEEVYKLGYPDLLLSFLNPELADEKIEFEGLNGTNFQYKKMNKSKRQDTYSESKACRMIRIAFDALDDYASKNKRNIHLIPEGILLPLHESAIQTLPDNKTKDTLRYKFLEILISPKDGEERSALLQSLFNGTYPKPNEPKKFYEAVQIYNDKIGEYLSKLF